MWHSVQCLKYICGIQQANAVVKCVKYDQVFLSVQQSRQNFINPLQEKFVNKTIMVKKIRNLPLPASMKENHTNSHNSVDANLALKVNLRKFSPVTLKLVCQQQRFNLQCKRILGNLNADKILRILTLQFICTLRLVNYFKKKTRHCDQATNDW